MQLKPEEISKIIRAQIKHYENVIEQSEVGTVIMVGDGIARASGLEKCMAGELLQFDNGEYGMAQNLEENTVSIVLLGSDVGIKEGSTVKRTGKVVSVPGGGGGLHGQGQRRPRIPQRGEPLRLLPRHGEVLRQAPQGRPARGRHRPRKLPPIKAAETESVNHNHSK